MANAASNIIPVEFKPAIRDHTNLLIGISSASGAGKTFSALRLARGLVGEHGKIALLDTEAGRAKHYADVFRFDHGDMAPPFSPQRFAELARKAETAGYGAMIIDSASDEYEGEGGLQDMHDAAMVRMAGKKSLDDLEAWQHDKLNAPGWKDPKQQHKRLLMARLRVMRMHLIFCLRAEEKIRFVKVTDDQGRERTKIESAGWVPICEKRFMYDMTVSMVFAPDNPGVPMMKDGKAIYGKIPEHLLFAFEPGKRVSEEAGSRLSAWANGGQLPKVESAASDDPLLTFGRTAAKSGTAALRAWWTALAKSDRKRLVDVLDGELKKTAEAADQDDDVSFDRSASPQSADEGGAAGDAESRPHPAAPLPSNEDEYKTHAAMKVAAFRPGDDPETWFASEAERTLRNKCHVSKVVFDAVQAGVKARAAELKRQAAA